MTIKKFEIAVTKEGRTWIGINDQIPIATEAKSYAGLIEIIQLVAPEVAIENGLIVNENDIAFTYKICEKTKEAA